MGVTAGVTRGIAGAVTRAITGMGAAEVISLDITDANYTCDQCMSGQTGTIRMSGFTEYVGYLDLTGTNSFTKFIARDLLESTVGVIDLRDNEITEVDMRNMTIGYADFSGNPLVTANFDSLQDVDGGHLYLSRNQSMITPPDFPALTVTHYAVTFSHNINMTGMPDVPLLETIHHEWEFQYTSVSVIDFPALKIMQGIGALPCMIIGGGDFAAIGETGIAAVTTLNTPLLEELTGAIRIFQTKDHPTSGGFTTWNYTPALWQTLGNHFSIELSRNSLSQSFMDDLLVHLASIAVGPYTETGTETDYVYNTIDLRFQLGGVTPSATGLAAKATLEALNIVVLV